jgi:prephenate dehydrogenase
MKSLGLIGFGQFGRLAASVLKSQFDVLVTDAADGAAEAARELGVGFGSVAEAAAREVVVVAVPVVAMRAMFEAIAPHLQPGALVIDVGSVKMLPVKWMLETLPAHVDIVATHPLFGPQSARTGLKGLRLVVCPVRGERHGKVVALGRELGLTVTVTTPEEHDKEMAYVQALTHLIGRSLVNLEIPDEQLKTPSYQHLLELCALIGADTFELFTAIQTQNPYAAEVAGAFVDQARSLLDQVAANRPD